MSNISIHDQKATVLAQTSHDHLVDRYHTFDRGWPENLQGFLLEQNLSLAGFFYTGDEDGVRCFSCGLELRHWKKEDVPFHKHISKQPWCDFIRNIKFQLDHMAPMAQLPHFDVSPAYKTMPSVAQDKLKDMKSLPTEVCADSLCVMHEKHYREVLFEPCSHFVVCEICSIECSHCPVCQSIIIKKTKYAKLKASFSETIFT